MVVVADEVAACVHGADGVGLLSADLDAGVKERGTLDVVLEARPLALAVFVIDAVGGNAVKLLP